ncbi:MAG TPA: glycosyltransferase [Candidatus Binatia bacterium]|nr:glycosyltransferase [Candidatus Binatia bacterium]
MLDRSLNILQVNSSDISGGAQRVAWNLARAYRDRGYRSSLAVGYKDGRDPDVINIRHEKAARGWSFFWWTLHSRLQRLDENGRPSRFARKLASPAAILDTLRGIEDFHFPGTWDLLNAAGFFPDILHCHNLHGGYFDLTALPWLSRQVRTVLTLHDAWLLSGHCAHSFNCERWRIGCGECPDLSIYPDIRRDATAHNWERKRQIYARSRFYVATPSKWLMEKVEQSILCLGMMGRKVVPNGVDLNLFHPAESKQIRASWGIPQDAKVILFTANGIRANTSKDFRTMREAVDRVVSRLGGQPLLFVALGEDGPLEHVGQAEIRFVPYQKNPETVARYYQAADVYLHAAKADTFPTTILEALACGAPVVATAVGGIPEQVKGLRAESDSMNHYELDEATGFLTSPGNAEEMSARVEQLLNDTRLHQQLSRNAVSDARRRFNLESQVDAYLNWYREILESAEDRSSSVAVLGVGQPKSAPDGVLG